MGAKVLAGVGVLQLGGLAPVLSFHRPLRDHWQALRIPYSASSDWSSRGEHEDRGLTTPPGQSMLALTSD